MIVKTGIDIVSVSRIERLLRKSNLAFLRRFLFSLESENAMGLRVDYAKYIDTRRTPAIFDRLNLALPSDDLNLDLLKAQSIAGIWSAKESFAKALGFGIGSQVSFHDIVVYKDSNGAPNIAINKEKLKQWNLKSISLSITHDSDIAAASCIVCQI